MLVPLGREPTWLLNTSVYKFTRRISFPNNAGMKNHADLNLGEVVCLSILYHITDSNNNYWMITIFIFDENHQLRICGAIPIQAHKLAQAPVQAHPATTVVKIAIVSPQTIQVRTKACAKNNFGSIVTVKQDSERCHADVYRNAFSLDIQYVRYVR